MLEGLKGYLKITWDNEDDYLKDIIARGKMRLKGLTGTELNFEEEGLSKDLLLDYCRYYYNSAIEYYEDNFQKEILRLQLKEAVKKSKEVVEDEG